MKISIEICIILISSFTILTLFLQFNAVNSESLKQTVDDELVAEKTSHLGAEFRETEDEFSEKVRKDSLELLQVKSFRNRRESSKSSETSMSSKEEEIVNIEKEIEQNLLREIINVVTMEFESLVFRSAYLFLTDYWVDIRSNFDNKEMVKGLVEFWQGEESEDLYPSLVSFFYKENMKRLKLSLYPSFDKKAKPKKKLLREFLDNADKLTCQDSKKSLAILILIFQSQTNYIYSSYLLYLLSCSHKDFYGMEFHESLTLILHKDFAEAKITSIADDNVASLIKLCKKKLGITHSGLSIKHKVKIRSPLNMGQIDFEFFGLNLCQSLLEISILRNLEFDFNYLILLFGSRFSKPEEVLMATDIFKFTASSVEMTTEIIALLLFNEATFASLKLKILLLHNVDISNLKDRFKECIQKIDLYQELNGIRFPTDFQKKSSRRSNPSEITKNRLRSKYPFVI
ncbi:membrane-associated protein [Cryptosporidium sp. chipmunk genotype I]|uniref:membrane-associated protein n=1 Tax=Cryptosporidium sp. chipmunk genotype I TaxID=1280935 RepID=UPI00351A089E|nr:membrane-associated protein [Cryptosporidium sp. chipmunk genotype I]